MAPIRVEIIGLSAAGGLANVAHLPYFQTTSKYQIVALANSSVASAKAAIAAFSFDPTTKAYGSPEEFAANPDIDRDKMAYVEWPLGKDLEEAQELTELAKSKGAKTVIGLQGRFSPLIQVVSGLVKSGQIGQILSSSFIGDVGWTDSVSQIPLRYKYFGDSSYGGNLVTIYFGHIIDSITYTLGELESFSSILANHFPVVNVVDNGVVVETGVPKDTDDGIIVHGKFVSGAVSSIHIRGNPPLPSTPGMQWRIVGDKGEILITGAKPNIQLGIENASIQLYDATTGSSKEIPIPTDKNSTLPTVAQNIGRLYDAFADDSPEYSTFQGALIKHRLINELFRSSKEGVRVSYTE
ncbi:putative oxidoreductase [Trichoderma velutinum]